MARQQISNACEHCGNPFHRPWRQRFCSHQCADTAKRRPLATRFARFVDTRGGLFGCWLWTGSMNGKYGQIGVTHQQPRLAHRVAWELAHGPIPNGLQVLHTCDNGRCVNVLHLFLGTQLDNMRDMVAKGREGHTGERHYKTKLTADNVRAIRTSQDTGAALARRFAVSPQVISTVRHRKAWKHEP